MGPSRLPTRDTAGIEPRHAPLHDAAGQRRQRVPGVSPARAPRADPDLASDWPLRFGAVFLPPRATARHKPPPPGPTRFGYLRVHGSVGDRSPKCYPRPRDMKRTLPLWGKHGGHDEQADYEEELRGRGAFLPPPRRPWWERWGKWLAVATVVGIPLGLLSLLAFC